MDDILTPLATGAGSALAVGTVARYLFQRWIQKNDENHDRWGSKIQEILVSLARIEERFKTIEATDYRVREQDKILAVISEQIRQLQGGLNGLGQKVRGRAAPEGGSCNQ